MWVPAPDNSSAGSSSEVTRNLPSRPDGSDNAAAVPGRASASAASAARQAWVMANPPAGGFFRGDTVPDRGFRGSMRAPSPIRRGRIPFRAMRLYINDVAVRDGFQIEKTFVPTATKIALVNQLARTGLHRIEVTSFVSPKVVPALADANEVLAGIDRVPGVIYF